MTLRELGFISYGGMIRGAIAFGLVLKIPDVPKDDPDYFLERNLVVTTTLAVVIITTVIFGSFMPLVQAILVPSDCAKVVEDINRRTDALEAAKRQS